MRGGRALLARGRSVRRAGRARAGRGGRVRARARTAPPSSACSSVRPTSRFSGSHASNFRRARSASYCARSTASRCPARRCSCWSSSSPIALAVAAIPAGATASRNASATALSSRRAAERLASPAGRMKVAAAYARVPADLAARARVRDLHLASTAAAAHQPLQQRAALARRAAALAARSHVRSQPLAGGEIIVPADIAGMVIGQADGPLLDRDVDAADSHLSVLVERA